MKKNVISPQLIVFIILALGILYFVFFNKSSFGFGGETKDITVPAGVNQITLNTLNDASDNPLPPVTLTIPAGSIVAGSTPTITIDSVTTIRDTTSKDVTSTLNYTILGNSYSSVIRTTKLSVVDANRKTTCITPTARAALGFKDNKAYADEQCKISSYTRGADSNAITCGANNAGFQYTCLLNVIPSVTVANSYDTSSVNNIAYTAYDSTGGQQSTGSITTGSNNTTLTDILPTNGYIKITITPTTGTAVSYNYGASYPAASAQPTGGFTGNVLSAAGVPVPTGTGAPNTLATGNLTITLPFYKAKIDTGNSGISVNTGI